MVEANTNASVDVTERRRYELAIDWSAVEKDPQARRRVHKLFEIAFSILKREGLLGKGLTPEQAMEALKSKNKDIEAGQEIEQSSSSNRIGKIEELVTPQPPEKEIRVRLPQDEWEQIGEEARRLHVSPTVLARKWILEGLSRHT